MMDRFLDILAQLILFITVCGLIGLVGAIIYKSLNEVLIIGGAICTSMIIVWAVSRLRLL